MADSLPLQPQSLKSAMELETDGEGSTPTVIGSEPGAVSAASSVSEAAPPTGGESIQALKDALVQKKQALMARKQELAGLGTQSSLQVSRSDESTDDPEKLHQKLAQLRQRLDMVAPILAQLDAEYAVSAELVAQGQHAASSTDMQLMRDIDAMKLRIETLEQQKANLEKLIKEIDDAVAADPSQAEALRPQRRQLDEQLMHLMTALEISKLEACQKMHEVSALLNHAQRHGEPMGYTSDQGTSSGYASEAQSSRHPFGCASHAGTDFSDAGEDSSRGGSGTYADTGGVILPWNMRPAANYYFKNPETMCCDNAEPSGPISDPADMDHYQTSQPATGGGGASTPPPSSDAGGEGSSTPPPSSDETQMPSEQSNPEGAENPEQNQEPDEEDDDGMLGAEDWISQTEFKSKYGDDGRGGPGGGASGGGGPDGGGVTDGGGGGGSGGASAAPGGGPVSDPTASLTYMRGLAWLGPSDGSSSPPTPGSREDVRLGGRAQSMQGESGPPGQPGAAAAAPSATGGGAQSAVRIVATPSKKRARGRTRYY